MRQTRILATTKRRPLRRNPVVVPHVIPAAPDLDRVDELLRRIDDLLRGA